MGNHDGEQVGGSVNGGSEGVLWGIDAGYDGAADRLFLEGNCIAIGWPEVGNLSTMPDDLGAFEALVAQTYPKLKQFEVPDDAWKLHCFVHSLRVGHFVVYPSENDKLVHLGRIEGDYCYDSAGVPRFPHRRRVNWLKAIPRTRFSLGPLAEIRGGRCGPFRVKKYTEDFRGALEGREYAPGLNEDEWRLIRLFRCMNWGERDETLLQTTKTLMRRYSVDPHFRPHSGGDEEARKNELSPENVEDFDWRLMSAWPAEWPNSAGLASGNVVDLDCTDDAGAFLEEVLCEGACYHILGISEGDESTAEMLASEYREAVIARGYPVPSEYTGTRGREAREREDLESFKADFLGFIQTWRERVVATIERQAREGGPQ